MLFPLEVLRRTWALRRRERCQVDNHTNEAEWMQILHRVALGICCSAEAWNNWTPKSNIQPNEGGGKEEGGRYLGMSAAQLLLQAPHTRLQLTHTDEASVTGTAQRKRCRLRALLTLLIRQTGT